MKNQRLCNIRGDPVSIQGEPVWVRSASAKDFDQLVTFLKGLSPQTFYLRFNTVKGCPEQISAEAKRLIQLDPTRCINLLILKGAGKNQTIIGHALIGFGPNKTGEIAIVISDEYQKNGLGKLMLAHAIEAAKSRGLKALTATVNDGNKGVRRLMSFVEHSFRQDGPELHYTIPIS